jgi:hypothetical protein
METVGLLASSGTAGQDIPLGLIVIVIAVAIPLYIVYRGVVALIRFRQRRRRDGPPKSS